MTHLDLAFMLLWSIPVVCLGWLVGAWQMHRYHTRPRGRLPLPRERRRAR